MLKIQFINIYYRIYYFFLNLPKTIKLLNYCNINQNLAISFWWMWFFIKNKSINYWSIDDNWHSFITNYEDTTKNPFCILFVWPKFLQIIFFSQNVNWNFQFLFRKYKKFHIYFCLKTLVVRCAFLILSILLNYLYFWLLDPLLKKLFNLQKSQKDEND